VAARAAELLTADRVIHSAESAVPASVVIHTVTGPEGTQLARWLHQSSPFLDALRPLIGSFPQPVVRVSGPSALLAEAARSLPEGVAQPEALAVRLRRAGASISWGAPEPVPDTASFLRLCHARGASSVELVRADPSLLTEMQLGAFFNAYWRRRVLRRAACRFGASGLVLRAPSAFLGLASDLAFWLGVRSAATSTEWERLARSSYLVFYYHGVGKSRPGQEHLHVRARRFERQLRLLALLGYRALSPEELFSFHANPAGTLPRRRFVVGADDGFRSAAAALRRHGDLRPHLFVNTSEIGGSAWWAFDEPLATWEELDAFRAAGGIIASHCRSHPRLPELDTDLLGHELTDSLRELRERLPDVPPLLAYPHGLHDERVRAAAVAAGYLAAFTTKPGRNGAGTDPYCLRRIGLKDWDGPAALLWVTMTGELLPWIWERSRRCIVGVRPARNKTRRT
jgi:peptidoglycan/xylan/chitin deacetylase (PgdA/CDA1 family)